MKGLLYAGLGALGYIALTQVLFPVNAATSSAYVIVQAVEQQFGRLVFRVQYSDGEQRELSAGQARQQFNNYCPRVRIAPGAFRE